jgi:signal transduction histidine kinase
MQLPKTFRIILIIVSLFVISGGILLYRSLERKIKYEKQNELAAIISLKVEDIAKWRMEHIRDATVFSNDIPLRKQISLFFQNDKKVELKLELLAWMQSCIQNYDFQSVLLLDNTRTVRLSFPPLDSGSNSLTALTLNALDSDKINFTDLHISDISPGIVIDLVIPLNSIDSARKENNTKIGTVVFRINPEIELFPLIQSWPTPSKSSETLLLRREGDSVMFLNELRHQKNTALRLKLPLTNEFLPAARAVLGFEGVFEGLDYRNVPVISFLSKIPDSRWFMVAKVDKKELYSPLNELIIFISVITFLVLLSVSILIGFYLRNQHIRLFKEQLDSELKRKSAEEAFQSLYNRNEAILGAISNIIMEVDKNKIYKWANEAGYEFFGKDVIGKEAAFYFAGEQDTNAILELMFSDIYDKIYVESWHRRVDNEKRLLAWWCKSLKDENGNVSGIISSASDITEQKKDEMELKENELRLRELNATKDKFFSIISHDLRSPFAGIINLTELLTEKMQNKDFSGTEEFADLINNSAQSAMDLITNLTVWTRSQTGRMVFNPKEEDIVAIIHEAIELLNASALQKAITIKTNTPLSLYIVADKAMISTVLRNLISNSIKFSKTGSEIIVSAILLGDKMRIEVRDSGVGIKKEDIIKLFRIETSFSTHGTQNEEGTGMGLILCKDFVLKHGGEIWAESEVGKGSKFTFTLPQQHLLVPSVTI